MKPVIHIPSNVANRMGSPRVEDVDKNSGPASDHQRSILSRYLQHKVPRDLDKQLFTPTAQKVVPELLAIGPLGAPIGGGALSVRIQSPNNRVASSQHHRWGSGTRVG